MHFNKIITKTSLITLTALVAFGCARRNSTLGSTQITPLPTEDEFFCSASANVTSASAFADADGNITANAPGFTIQIVSTMGELGFAGKIVSYNSSNVGVAVTQLPTNFGLSHQFVYSARKLGAHKLTFNLLKNDVGGESTSCDVTVNVIRSEITLSSIAISPTTSSTARGATRNFTATGTYSDGSTIDITNSVDWASSNTAIATISEAQGSQGRLTAVAVGTANITASLDGKSATVPTNVVAASLVSIAVTPNAVSLAKGRTQQLVATGTYSDNSTAVITESVAWSLSAANIASISNTAGSRGRVNALAVGSVNATAVQGSVSSSAVAITVTAAVLQSIALNPTSAGLTVAQTRQFQATGTMSDLTTTDVTNAATWSSSASAQASVSNTSPSKGLVTAVAAGAPTIRAAVGTIQAEAVVTVTVPVTLVSLAITPNVASQTLNLGQTLQFTVRGTYSNSTTADLSAVASWSSSNASVATISNSTAPKGLAAAVGPGATTIIATHGGMTASAPLSVGVRQLYFTFSNSGSFDQTLNQILGSSNAFNGFNFKSHRFKVFVSERLLSRINYGTKQSYTAGEVGLSSTPASQASITGITRYFADRNQAAVNVNPSCTLVPDAVFAADRVDFARVNQNGNFINLVNQAGNIYIFKDEQRDRWATSGQNCYPTIHSSAAVRAAAATTAPTFSGYPWASDGYSNTYGNGAFLYVDGNGQLHLKYHTQTVYSRVVFVVGIIADP